MTMTMTMNEPLKILGIPGSLRHSSYNRAALVAAKKMLPSGVTLDIIDLNGLPMFDDDMESPESPNVAEFKKKIREADALLFSTPEYNYSIPSVLKNAIDCASMPHGKSALIGKPVAVMGVSVGLFGASRAQYHLRQCFDYLDMFPVHQHEVMIEKAGMVFDVNGTLTDEKSLRQIRDLVGDLTTWAWQLRKKQFH